MTKSGNGDSRTIRRKGRWFRTIAGLAVVVAVLVAIAPHVIAQTSLRNDFLQKLVGNSNVSVSSSGASFGWFSPLEITDLKIESSSGDLDIAVERLLAEKSWLDLWLSSPDLGKLDFVRPQVKIVVDDQQDPATNQEPWPNLSAVITDGSLLLQERSQPRPAVDAHQVDIRFQIQQQSGRSMLIVDPIQLVDQEPLTPEICVQGLQLVAPELSEEISIDGTYSLKLISLRLPLDSDETDPEASIEGVVTLHEVSVGLKNDVTQRLALLAAELGKMGEVPERIRLTDNVELAFRFQDGRISHEGMAAFFPDLVPGLSIRSTGTVGIDESLDLQVFMQIPITVADESALAKELSETPVQLHVVGTIEEPQLSVPAEQPWLTILKDRQSSDDVSAEDRALAAGLMKALTQYLDKT